MRENSMEFPWKIEKIVTELSWKSWKLELKIQKSLILELLELLEKSWKLDRNHNCQEFINRAFQNLKAKPRQFSHVNLINFQRKPQNHIGNFPNQPI